jgi:hypothetical protein
MASTTYYVALPFVPGPDGPVPSQAVECQSAGAAKAAARALSHNSKHVGAIAFQRIGDPDEGKFGVSDLVKHQGTSRPFSQPSEAAVS